MQIGHKQFHVGDGEGIPRGIAMDGRCKDCVQCSRRRTSCVGAKVVDKVDKAFLHAILDEHKEAFFMTEDCPGPPSRCDPIS